ncbi:MAG: hypothetical protein K5Q68_10915 [Roseococcus sp.]|nr:hypothetical protein [Roseococcus sp.]
MKDRPNRAAAPRLVFLHLPRTGGTTLHQAWSLTFRLAEICPERFARLHEYRPEEIAAYRFFSGHFRFDQFWSIPQPRFLVTVLRDPIERVLSLFEYWRSFRPGVIAEHDLLGPRLARERGLLGFLRSEEVEVTTSIDNAMVCHLAGDAMPVAGGFGTLTSEGRDRMAPETLLATAFTALRHFDCVGEIGSLQRVHDRVAAVFGMRPGPLPRVNAAHDASPFHEALPREQVTPAIMVELRRLTRLDRQLVLAARSDPGIRRA